MPELRPILLQRLLGRPGVVVGLASAVALGGIALPGLVGTSATPRSAAPAALASLWDEFARTYDPAESRTGDFERWFVGESGSRVATELSGRAHWSHAFEGDSFSVALDDGDPGGAWVMEVEPALWRGSDFTLAADDLACVLCHSSVERDPQNGSAGTPAPQPQLASRMPFEEPMGAQLELDASFVALDSDWIPDLESWLAAGHEGDLRASFGLEVEPGGTIGLEALTLGALGPLRVLSGSAAHVVAIGTDEAPIRIRGDLGLRGDLVLSGVIVGDGQIVAEGNVFLMGSLVHAGSGSVRIGALGSVLAGDPARPRSGDRVAVTGMDDGSYSFALEALARFNRRVTARTTNPPYTWSEAAGAPVQAGRRSAGSWGDQGLEIRASGPDMAIRVVGPTGEVPWLDLGSLDPRALGWPVPVGTAGRTVIEAVIVARGAFIAVAGPVANTRDPLPYRQRAAGALELHGAVVASHAAVHAPLGLLLRDDVHGRAGQDFAAGRGIRRRMRRASELPDPTPIAGRLPRPAMRSADPIR